VIGLLSEDRRHQCIEVRLPSLAPRPGDTTIIGKNRRASRFDHIVRSLGPVDIDRNGPVRVAVVQWRAYLDFFGRVGVDADGSVLLALIGETGVDGRLVDDRGS